MIPKTQIKFQEKDPEVYLYFLWIVVIGTCVGRRRLHNEWTPDCLIKELNSSKVT